MRACWLKWVGRDWSISADYIWLNYSDANILGGHARNSAAISQWTSTSAVVVSTQYFIGSVWAQVPLLAPGDFSR